MYHIILFQIIWRSYFPDEYAIRNHYMIFSLKLFGDGIVHDPYTTSRILQLFHQQRPLLRILPLTPGYRGRSWIWQPYSISSRPPDLGLNLGHTVLQYLDSLPRALWWKKWDGIQWNSMDFFFNQDARFSLTGMPLGLSAIARSTLWMLRWGWKQEHSWSGPEPQQWNCQRSHRAPALWDGMTSWGVVWCNHGGMSRIWLMQCV